MYPFRTRESPRALPAQAKVPANLPKPTPGLEPRTPSLRVTRSQTRHRPVRLETCGLVAGRVTVEHPGAGRCATNAPTDRAGRRRSDRTRSAHEPPGHSRLRGPRLPASQGAVRAELHRTR